MSSNSHPRSPTSTLDFFVSGNNTTTVVIKLAIAQANTITLHAATPINLSSADFLFY